MTDQQSEGPASPSRDIPWHLTQDHTIEGEDFNLDQFPGYSNIAYNWNELDQQPQIQYPYVQWDELGRVQTQEVFT
jgi:hypothetical protein